VSVIRSVDDASIEYQSEHQILQSFVEILIAIIFDDSPYSISDGHLLIDLVIHELPQNVSRVHQRSSRYASTYTDQDVVHIRALKTLLQIFPNIIVDSFDGEDATHHNHVTFPEAIETLELVDSLRTISERFV
jgi:hypothetical protein